MGVTKFRIEYDRPVATFSPGKEVRGRVILGVDKYGDEVCGIQIQLKGTGHVEWTDTKEEKHSQDEMFCYIEDWIIGSPGAKYRIMRGVQFFPGTMTFTETPADHCYPFAITLPVALPSSFEGAYGYVRYTAKAILVRSLRNDPKALTADKPFTVNATVDLNTYVEAKLVPHFDEMAELGWCWCSSEALLFNLRLNKGGYVPGENILINGVVHNRSDIVIHRITMMLVQFLRYRAGNNTTMKTQRTVYQGERGRIEARSEQVWSNVAIRVPPLPPTDLGIPESIIGVRYELQIQATPDGFEDKAELQIPVLVGTERLNDDSAAGRRPLTPPCIASEPHSPSVQATDPALFEPGGHQDPAPHSGQPSYIMFSPTEKSVEYWDGDKQLAQM